MAWVSTWQEHQTTVVVQCLEWLQMVYNNQSKVVLLVGHSMGGLVGQAALSRAAASHAIGEASHRR